MNTYELMVMYKSDTKEADVKKGISALKDKIKDLSGKVKGEDYWGLKNLSYEMDKYVSAYYEVLTFEMESDQTELLKSWLKQQEETVLRTLLTKV